MSSSYPLRRIPGPIFNIDDFDEEKNRKHSNYISIKNMEKNSNDIIDKMNEIIKSQNEINNILIEGYKNIEELNHYNNQEIKEGVYQINNYTKKLFNKIQYINIKYIGLSLLYFSSGLLIGSMISYYNK